MVYHSLHKQLLTEGPDSANCDERKELFQFLKTIQSMIPESNTGAERALNNAAESVHLYMGHQIRRYAQDKKITEVRKTLRLAYPHKELIIVMDYEIKLEPIRWRETMATFYGNRG